MPSPREELLVLLRGLNLGAMASAVEDTALRAAKEGLSHEAFLLELARTERAAKSARRVERLRHQSELLPGKNFRALDLNRFAPAIRMQIERLRDVARGPGLRSRTRPRRTCSDEIPRRSRPGPAAHTTAAGR